MLAQTHTKANKHKHFTESTEQHKPKTHKNKHRQKYIQTQFAVHVEPQLQGGQFPEKIGQHIIVTGRLATTRPSAKGDSFPHGVQAGTVPLFVRICAYI